MIGIFDSGVGGLTVARELLKNLPKYRLIYLGDTARLPYGTKSPELIRKWSLEISSWLVKKGAKVIIIACHTASSLAGDYLKEKLPKLPVFEITTPGIKKAAEITRNKKIGIIGSPGTIRSEIHQKKLLKIDPFLKVYSKSCPLFVPLVEEGWLEKKQAKEIAKEYLFPLREKGIDTLVLACTHYPMLKKTISEIMGENVKIVDPAQDLAKEFREFLENNQKIKKQIKSTGKNQFFFSDQPYNLKIISKKSLGKEIFPKIENSF